MERQDPKFGKLPDLTEPQFRPQRTHHRVAQRDSGLTWKIGAGVFLGLALFGLMTCTGLVVVGSAVQQEQDRQAKKAVEAFTKAANDPDPFGYAAREAERQRRETEYYALRPGERCIDGKRFRRVENGWVQVNRPCR